MPNMNDYLQWRGDLTLDERPFNDVDNLILASLSYLDFRGIVPTEKSGGEPIRLSTACKRLIAQAEDDFSAYVCAAARLDEDYARLLAQSKRLGRSLIHSHVDVVSEAQSLQFAAVQVDLPNGETYVSFRGTDTTLVGWREDFMLSFTVTEAQHRAARYLERAAKRARKLGRTLRVGGHSKGGVLAEYAAVSCSDEARELIRCVYSNDGPGMDPEVLPASGRAVLGARMRRIVPAYSVVGMLFARADEPREIVVSDDTGIGQHDPTTWQVTPEGFQTTDELLPDAVVLNRAIARWADGVPLDERERVTDEVFDALGAGGAVRFEEITATNEGLRMVLRALNNTDERTREVSNALVQSTLDSSVDAAREAAEEAMDQMRREVRVHAKGAVQMIFEASGGRVKLGDKRREATIKM